jgi:hypothetical protein
MKIFSRFFNYCAGCFSALAKLLIFTFILGKSDSFGLAGFLSISLKNYLTFLPFGYCLLNNFFF